MGINRDDSGKIKLSLAPSELAALVAILGVTASWVLLPHRMSQVEKVNDAQATAISAVEKMVHSDRIDMADIKATLRSIDARTKRMEERLP